MSSLTTTTCNVAYTAPGVRQAPVGIFTRVLNWLMAADSAARQRAHLKVMPAYLREDIGVTQRQVLTETAVPVWDAPIQLLLK